MNKPNKDFRLSKSSKRILARLDGEQKNHWKKMLIDAEIAEKRAKFAKLTKLSNDE